MSVIVRGMEMPKNCALCKFRGAGETWCPFTLQEVPGNTIPEDCPLTPVPPHGDLVDRDEIFEEFVVEGQKSTRYKIGERWELNGAEIRRVIARLPAVIPAEEGDRC